MFYQINKMWIKFVFFMCAVILCESLKFASLDKVYKKGTDAYSKEKWSECIVQLEETLHLYKVYKSVIVNCRVKCKSVNRNSEVEDIEDLKIFEYFFKVGQCISTCQQQEFENVHIYNNVTDTVLKYLQSKKPYQYLHICYFEMNDLPKAATAAYTYLVANPNDNEMKKNVDFYIQQPEVDKSAVINLESDDYQVLYKLGMQAYKQNKWAETINHLEEAITNFFSWENSCRAECDHQPEQGWSPEMAITISYNIASVLSCRQKCQDELRPDYNSGVEILSDLMNYLQISYYHLDKIESAAKAVATYLALYPNDVDMLDNKNIYQTLTDSKNFVGRSDVIYYFKRDEYEKQLLNYFYKEDRDPNAISV